MLTLVEAAKLHSGDVVRSAIIDIYAGASDLMQVLPFADIQGNSLRYNQEKTLPGIGFRGVNESYSESTGILNPISEPLVIAGGDLDVDTFILKTMGEDQRAVQEAMKAKALSLAWTKKFIKGDSTSEPREFDGLQTRLTGNQLVEAGSTSGGDVLSLAQLDAAIDACANPTHICINKTLRRRLSAAARSTSVSGNIHWEKDEFGRQIMYYGELPILIFDEDETGSQILPFTESGSGGGTAQCTSLYVVSLGEGMIQGIQNGVLDARDLGELQTKSAKRTRVEWFSGMAVFHPKAAVRLRGVKDGAVTT